MEEHLDCKSKGWAPGWRIRAWFGTRINHNVTGEKPSGSVWWTKRVAKEEAEWKKDWLERQAAR